MGLIKRRTLALVLVCTVGLACATLGPCESAVTGRYGPSKAMCDAVTGAPHGCKHTKAVRKGNRVVKKATCVARPPPPASCEEANTFGGLNGPSEDKCISAGDCIYTKKTRKRVKRAWATIPAKCGAMPAPYATCGEVNSVFRGKPGFSKVCEAADGGNCVLKKTSKRIGRKTIRGETCVEVTLSPTKAPTAPPGPCKAVPSGKYGPSKAACLDPSVGSAHGCKHTPARRKGHRIIARAKCTPLPPPPASCEEASKLNDHIWKNGPGEATCMRSGDCIYGPATKRGGRIISRSTCFTAPAPLSSCDDTNLQFRGKPGFAKMCGVAASGGCIYIKASRGNQANCIGRNTCKGVDVLGPTADVCSSVPGGCKYTPQVRRGRRVFRAKCEEIPEPAQFREGWKLCSHEPSTCRNADSTNDIIVRFSFKGVAKAYRRLPPSNAVKCKAADFGISLADEFADGQKCDLATMKGHSWLSCDEDTKTLCSTPLGSVNVVWYDDGAAGRSRYRVIKGSFICKSSHWGIGEALHPSGKCKFRELTAQSKEWHLASTNFVKHESKKLIFVAALVETGEVSLSSDMNLVPYNNAVERCAQFCLGSSTCKSFTLHMFRWAGIDRAECYSTDHSSKTGSETLLVTALPKKSSRKTETWDYYELDASSRWHPSCTGLDCGDSRVPEWCTDNAMTYSMEDNKRFATSKKHKPTLNDPCKRWRKPFANSMFGCGLSGSKVDQCGFCAFTPVTDDFSRKKVDFREATEVCKSRGARLCTLSEVIGGNARGTGSGLDYIEIWTSNVCNVGKRVGRSALIGNGFRPPVCSPENHKQSVRCCSSEEDRRFVTRVVSTLQDEKIQSLQPISAVVELGARKGLPAPVITVKTTLPSTKPPLLDFMLLQDNSGSFGNDLENLRILSRRTTNTLKKMSGDSLFGVASFQNKPKGLTDKTNYAYRLDQSLTREHEKFDRALHRLSGSGGWGHKENALEAVMMVALRHDVGWRKDSIKIVLVATDEDYQKQGDVSKYEGVQNNYDGVLNGHPAGIGEDYPEPSRVGKILEDKGIVPIFAVIASPSVEPKYRELVEMWGFGYVIRLEDASSDFLEKMAATITEILHEVELNIEEDIGGTIESIKALDCGSGTSDRKKKCASVRDGETVTFEVKFKATTPAQLISGAVATISSSPNYGKLKVDILGGSC